MGSLSSKFSCVEFDDVRDSKRDTNRRDDNIESAFASKSGTAERYLALKAPKRLEMLKRSDGSPTVEELNAAASEAFLEAVWKDHVNRAFSAGPPGVGGAFPT